MQVDCPLPSDSAFGEFGLDLRTGFKENGVYAVSDGAVDIFLDVIGKEAFFGLALGFFDGDPVDGGRGLHGADFVGEHIGVEVAHERVVLNDHIEVDGIGVGE